MAIEPLGNSLIENRFLIYSKVFFKIAILGEGLMPKLPFHESVIHSIKEADSFDSLRVIARELSRTKIPGNHQKIMDVFQETFDRLYEEYSKEFEELSFLSLGLPLNDSNMLMNVQAGHQLIDKNGAVWQVAEKYLGNSQNAFSVGFSLVCPLKKHKMNLYCLLNGVLVVDLDTKEIATSFYKNLENSSILYGRVIFSDE